jgi:predicted dehydrogenase
VLTIGIIGIGGHAKRIFSILVNRYDISSIKFYHPSKRDFGITVTNTLADLLQCDAIFIASPNETHYEYLMFLEENFHGYILCEKPPVISLEQLSSLRLSSGKVFFNFNYRFSDYFYKIKEEIDSGRLGNPIFVFIAFTHGFAFKNEYLTSWRSKSITHKNGVVETVSIHFIDLFIYLFGSVFHFEVTGCNQSGRGDATDTAVVRMQFQKNLEITILASYSAPFSERMIVYGTNGMLEICNDDVISQSPRDTFDDQGYFSPPPIIANKSENIYQASLEKSIDYFLSVCKVKERFNPKHLEASISTCKILFM